jgi:hypothetical protein
VSESIRVLQSIADSIALIVVIDMEHRLLVVFYSRVVRVLDSCTYLFG